MSKENSLKKDIEGLLEQFTNYEPGMESYEFSVEDHIFLDDEFWPSLIEILKESK